MADYPNGPPVRPRAAELPRLMQPVLERALGSSPVVVLTGARQTGKSTLARRVGAALGHDYRTLDDLVELERAEADPEAFVRSASRLVLDEVQRLPRLLLAVKRVVDEQREAGRFLLTGSANLLLMQRVAESLAGRAVYLTLWPLTRGELEARAVGGGWADLWEARDADWEGVLAGGSAAADWRQVVRRGGYPTPAHELRDDESRALWFAGYSQTYLERDLRDLSSVASLTDFRRLMQAVCLRIGSLVNRAEIGRDLGLPQSTVRNWLDLLETSYQLVRVPAYSVNRTRRLIKTPKLYWADTGLALHLSGEAQPRGAHLENHVLCDLLAWTGSLPAGPNLCYWRTAAGEEVDFVIEWKGRLLPIEVKSTERPRPADARGLLAFRDEYGQVARSGLLLHAGSETLRLAEGVLALPWWRVC